ncbi:MAG: DegV family protein [Oscillospiraceae bacterium]|nr:DegV family protein [Oscillospiraceae bacterium]
MSTFTILTDTSYDLPEQFINDNQIAVVPIPFHLDGTPHPEGRWQEISDVDFYNKLRDGSSAGTAQINPETYVQIFTKYAEKGEPVLALFLSSGLSPSYGNSVIALSEVKEKHPDCQIFTVDSLNAAGGVGVLVALAVKKRSEGLSLEETAKWLEEKRHSCLSLFTVDDLHYLHRGGRLSKLQAVAGSLIGIKPLLNVAPDGTLKLKDKARGRKAALETIAAQMKRSINKGTKLDTVVISHSNCESDAELVAELIKKSFEVGEFKIVMMGPVIGAHVGPGCIALFFEADIDRPTYESRYYAGK